MVNSLVFRWRKHQHVMVLGAHGRSSSLPKPSWGGPWLCSFFLMSWPLLGWHQTWGVLEWGKVLGYGQLTDWPELLGWIDVFFCDERNTFDHYPAFRFRCIVDTWRNFHEFVIPILGSAYEHLEVAVVFRELFQVGEWTYIYIYCNFLHPKNWNKKKVGKIIDANFSPTKCSCLSSSVKDWQSPNNRRLGDADNPGFQRSWWFLI